jgi:hypothetical protein
MEKLLRDITPEKRIVIKGKELKIKAKSVYVTQSNPFTSYTKVFLERHHALVICPKENFIYFGKDIGSIGINPPFPKQIPYNGEKYRMIAHDYQIVKCLEFGDPLETEGEVEFWDFQGETNNILLLSLAIVTRTNKRADIIAQVLSIKDIEVISKK